MPSAITKYYRRKEIVSLLNRLSEQRAPIDAFTPHVEVLWDKTEYVAADTRNQKIYRGRLNCKGELFTHTEQLSYPPTDRVRRKNRFNDIGESIFYGSLGIVEPIMEIIPVGRSAPRLFTLSIAQRINKAPLLAVPFGFPVEQYQQRIKAAHRVSIEYFNKEILKTVEDNDEEFYNSTISIGRFVLTKGIVNSPGSLNAALVYPSVKARNGGANIAMIPTLFDEYFKFTEVAVCCLASLSPEKNVIQYLNKGEIDSVGNIDWLYNHTEMMKRIRAGLILGMGYVPDDSVAPEVTTATDDPQV